MKSGSKYVEIFADIKNHFCSLNLIVIMIIIVLPDISNNGMSIGNIVSIRLLLGPEETNIVRNDNRNTVEAIQRTHFFPVSLIINALIPLIYKTISKVELLNHLKLRVQ